MITKVIGIGAAGNKAAINVVENKIIDIDTCVEVTKVINPLLDDLDVIEDSYILDITTKEKGGSYE